MSTTEKQKAACDRALTKAAKTIIGSIGASPEMMLDRVLTFAAAHMVSITGKQASIDAFRHCAQVIEQGTFDHFDPTATEAKH